MSEFFIGDYLYVKDTKRGFGVFTKKAIVSNTVIEHSPFSSCWESNWANTPENLKKIVFTYPKGIDNYVIALGYISIYNHSDNHNADWETSHVGLYVKTIKDINPGEEIFINYGQAYWASGWTKF